MTSTVTNPSSVQFTQMQPNSTGNLNIITNGGNQQSLNNGGGTITTQNISRNVVISNQNGNGV